MNRIILTGASGGLAQLVLKELAQISMRTPVRVLAMDVTTPDPEISQPTNTHWRIGNIDERSIASVFADFRPTVVIHLAAITGQRAEADPVVSRRVNVELAQTLMDHCHQMKNPARFVQASSIAAIGDTGGALTADETTECAPVSHYGHGKRIVELDIIERRNAGQDVIALRIPTLLVRMRARAGKPTSGFLSDFVKDLLLQGFATSPMPEDYPVAVASNAEAAHALVRLALAKIPSDTPAVLNLPAVCATPHKIVQEAQDLRECTAEYAQEPALEITQLIDKWPKNLESHSAEHLGVSENVNKTTRLQKILKTVFEDLNPVASSIAVKD